MTTFEVEFEICIEASPCRARLSPREGDENQVVGIHQRNGDLKVNVAKRKAATNVRSNKDATVVLNEPKSLSLDDCVEYIGNDELVEVTPESIRILKNPKMDKKAMKQQGMKK